MPTIDQQHPDFAAWHRLAAVDSVDPSLTIGTCILKVLWMTRVLSQLVPSTWIRDLVARGCAPLILLASYAIIDETIKVPSLMPYLADSAHSAVGYYCAGALQLARGQRETTDKSQREAFFAQGYKYFIAAADQGYLSAYVMLGLLHLAGDGGAQKSSKLAVEFWLKTPELPVTQRLIAVQEFQGDGITQNVPQALARLELAHKYGDPQAAFILGDLLYTQLPAEDRNAKEALKWFQAAYDQRPDDRIAFVIAELHHRNVDPQICKPAVALEMMQIAADRGNSAAMSVLGIFHGQGIHTPQNDAAARKWLEQAAAKQGVHISAVSLWARQWLRQATILKHESNEDKSTKTKK
jgi:TPR repeat protein